MNAKRIDAAKQMSDFLRQERQMELLEATGARADKQLGLQQDQFGLSQQQFGLQQQQFEAGEKRAAGEEARADRRLGVEEDRLSLIREEMTHKKLQDASAQAIGRAT